METRKTGLGTVKSHPRFLKCVLKSMGVALKVDSIEWVFLKNSHQNVFIVSTVSK